MRRQSAATARVSGAFVATGAAVVDIITRLRLAAGRHVAVAVAETWVAGGDPARSVDASGCSIHGRADVAACAAVVHVVLRVEAVVDDSVAVVVKVIADLLRRKDLALACRTPSAVGLAGLGPALADAHAFRARWAAVARLRGARIALGRGNAAPGRANGAAGTCIAT